MARALVVGTFSIVLNTLFDTEQRQIHLLTPYRVSKILSDTMKVTSYVGACARGLRHVVPRGVRQHHDHRVVLAQLVLLGVAHLRQRFRSGFRLEFVPGFVSDIVY